MAKAGLSGLHCSHDGFLLILVLLVAIQFTLYITCSGGKLMVTVLCKNNFDVRKACEVDQSLVKINMFMCALHDL